MRTWTTDAVHANERFGYWREVLCQAFVWLNPVRSGDARGDVFHGRVRTRNLASTAQTSISSSRQTNDRRLEEIRQNPVEFCFANFQLEGTCIARQDGRESIVRPGDFYVVDTSRPYFLNYLDAWSVLSFRIPTRQLVQRVGETRRISAKCVDGSTGLGLVATRFARSLEHVDEALPGATQEGLSSTLNDVIGMALGPFDVASDAQASAQRLATRRAVEIFVDNNLADPSLSPDTVAARFKMSRRLLYTLFEQEELSVSGLIRVRRLQRCARDLGADGRPNILHIALKWGFNDPSHFSRLFKSHFGVSPREFAENAKRGM